MENRLPYSLFLSFSFLFSFFLPQCSLPEEVPLRPSNNKDNKDNKEEEEVVAEAVAEVEEPLKVGVNTMIQAQLQCQSSNLRLRPQQRIIMNPQL